MSKQYISQGGILEDKGIRHYITDDGLIETTAPLTNPMRLDQGYRSHFNTLTNSFKTIKSTLVSSGTNNWAWATHSINTKHYVEYVIEEINDTPTAVSVGIGDRSTVNGALTDGIYFHGGTSGNTGISGVASTNHGQGNWAIGDVIMLATDPTTNKVWIGKNGVWALDYNPEAGIGGWTYGTNGKYFGGAVVSNSTGLIKQITTRFFANELTYTPPTGFVAPGDPAPTLPEIPLRFDMGTRSSTYISADNGFKTLVTEPRNVGTSYWTFLNRKITGKQLYEFQTTAGTQQGYFGIGSFAGTNLNNIMASGISWRDRYIYIDGVNSADLGSTRTVDLGDKIFLATDADLNKFWVGTIKSGESVITWMGSGTQDPATNQGGWSYSLADKYVGASVYITNGVSNRLESRLTATEQSVSAPSGFTAAGDSAAPTGGTDGLAGGSLSSISVSALESSLSASSTISVSLGATVTSSALGATLAASSGVSGALTNVTVSAMEGNATGVESIPGNASGSISSTITLSNVSASLVASSDKQIGLTGIIVSNLSGSATGTTVINASTNPPLNSTVNLSTLAASVLADANKSIGLTGIIVTPIGANASGSGIGSASGTLGSTTTVTALGGSARGSASASKSINSTVTISPNSGTANGTGNTSSNLGGIVTITQAIAVVSGTATVSVPLLNVGISQLESVVSGTGEAIASLSPVQLTALEATLVAHADITTTIDNSIAVSNMSGTGLASERKLTRNSLWL